MDAETMLHPFTKVPSEVKHLEPGDPIEEGDVYRSATILDERTGLGRWFAASDVLAGTTVSPTCNVHFMRMLPIRPLQEQDDPS